jgi:hypothetical protein
MHPSLLVPELQGLERSVYDTLARRGGNGISQTRILQLLELSSSSQSSVSRALSKLIASGLVEKTGSTRDAAFNLTKEAKWFSIPGPLRPQVAYDPMRFRSYDPINAPWLDPQARASMTDSVGAGSVDLDPTTYTREIAERFLIEMSWASSALEGSTYSLPEAEALIKYAEVAGNKSQEEAQMILNHKQAIGWVIDNIGSVEIASERCCDSMQCSCGISSHKTVLAQCVESQFRSRQALMLLRQITRNCRWDCRSFAGNRQGRTIRSRRRSPCSRV